MQPALTFDMACIKCFAMQVADTCKCINFVSTSSTTLCQTEALWWVLSKSKEVTLPDSKMKVEFRRKWIEFVCHQR